jgi:hypothetical protein
MRWGSSSLVANSTLPAETATDGLLAGMEMFRALPAER